METGFLGSSNPEQLLYTVLFVLGLNCALHAGKEHRSLRSIPFNSKLTWMYDDQGVKFLRYQEDVALKTNKGILTIAKSILKL